MLYSIFSRITHRYKQKRYYSYHTFIAHAENEKQLKAYFRASKPDFKIMEIEGKNSDIIELNI